MNEATMIGMSDDYAEQNHTARLAGDIINLSRERAKREEPDADCVRKDDHGRPLYLYALEYSFDDRRWAAEIWAYSMEEAQARVDGMRQSLVLCGQTFAVVPG